MRPAIVVHGGVGISGDEAVPEALGGVTEAARRGQAVLERGGSALEAVLEAVRTLEDDPHFNAGTGSALTEDGAVETDASVMWGQDLTAGGVAVFSGFRNPILVAEAVRAQTPHVLLAGPGAQRFAAAHGFESVGAEAMVTPAQRRKWQAEVERRASAKPPASPDKLGTVGAVACDRAGHVAAATSTGGLFFKMPGRIGDTPIIGAGTYADDAAGAASSTGKGEAILKTGLARLAVDCLAAEPSAQRAAEKAMAEFGRRTGSEAGVILVDAQGNVGLAFNTRRMSRAYWWAGEPGPTALIER